MGLNKINMVQNAHDISKLIENGKIIEAYIAVSNGAEVHPIDFAFLQSVVEGVEKVDHYNLHGFLVRNGSFTTPTR